ncbi:MAG: hypothetical protein WD206_09955 [Actinomycetota bacterium]
MGVQRFDFAIDPRYEQVLRLFGVGPGRAWVGIDERSLRVRFGFWRFSTPVANIERTCVTGPYTWALKAIGPRVSLADRGLSFGTNTERGVCVLLREPVPSRATLGAIKHPGVTVTVGDVDGLVAAIDRLRAA